MERNVDGGSDKCFGNVSSSCHLYIFGKASEVQLKLANKTEPILKGDRTGKMKVACPFL